MADTLTTSLSLTKIQVGASDDTWGGKLNANMDLIDAQHTAASKAIKALTPAADRLPYFTSASAAALATFTAFARTLLDDNDAAAMRTTLGLSALATLASPVPVANGGTGATDAATARTNLGLAIGSNVQAYDADLGVIAGLAKSDGNFIVGDGANWVVENGATARASLGLGAAAEQAYVSGTFTPTLIGTTAPGSGTYNAQVGRYTRIGNRVFFNIYLEWTAHTGTGDMRISGLPLTSANVTNGYSAVSLYFGSISFTDVFLQGYVPPNSTQIFLAESTTAGGVSGIAMDTAGNITLSGHYEV